MSTREEAFIHNQGQTSPFPFLIDVDYASGLYIYDKAGKAYLDLIAGVAVNNIGHNHPKVVEAIKKQVDKHLHVMVYGEFIQDAQLELANKLTQLLPERLNCVYTVNSGTEANEAAIKLAKRATGRSEIISCYGAYHGSTNGSLSISANEHKKAAFRPLIPGIQFIKHNAIEDLAKITNKTAAVFIEPIQGDAGVRIATKEYLVALRNKCNETGTLLVFDEIQCGMGRTGKLFAFEHYGVEPDILTLGKALGGGMPIGAIVSSNQLLKQFTENPMLGHITTFGGHPVVCAAAKACLDVLSLMDWNAIEKKGQRLKEVLLQSNEVKAIRQKGLMFAIDMESSERVEQVVKKCLEMGMLTFWFLSHPYSFRLSPPLTISEKEIELAGAKILEAISLSR